MPSKSLDQLEGVVWDEPSFDSHVVTTCHRLRTKPIDEFGVEDLRIMTFADLCYVDLIVAYRPDFDLVGELRPFEYNVLSKRAVRARYRFDAFAVPDGSASYVNLVEFFTRVRMDDPDQPFPRERKGLLRIVL